jgi:hypothetical protein
MKPKRRIKVNDTELTTVFSPKNAASGQPIELAMQRLWLVGRVLGVGARLLVKHTFRSGEKKPLEVIYGFGLPRGAALRSRDEPSARHSPVVYIHGRVLRKWTPGLCRPQARSE